LKQKKLHQTPLQEPDQDIICSKKNTRQVAILAYLKINNAEPKPFVWTKSADMILASIERFCLRIFNSGH
jgi:hypothetical protein